MKKICSLLLAVVLTLSLCTVSFGTEVQDKRTLPTNEQVSSMDKILPLFDETATEEVSQAMLDAMRYVSGAQTHNNGCTTTYTPSKQASAMTKVS